MKKILFFLFLGSALLQFGSNSNLIVVDIKSCKESKVSESKLRKMIQDPISMINCGIFSVGSFGSGLMLGAYVQSCQTGQCAEALVPCLINVGVITIASAFILKRRCAILFDNDASTNDPV